MLDSLRQALRLREELMAAAAHELKTPVTVIKGRTQLLLRQEADVPGLRQPLESILRHANRIALLVQDLLAVGKVRPGLTALQCERFDLSALTREQALQIAQATESEMVHVDVDGPLIIDAHRGRMWVTSVPGQGSTFAFSLPLTSSG